MRSLLRPVSWLFGGAVALRNRGFDSGLLRARDAGIPVISVGNLSVGGTGKTPLTEEIAGMLIRNGYRTGILSRGYGRDTTGFRWVRRGTTLDHDTTHCGDEPVQMALNVEQAYVAVDEDRAAGATRMVAEERIDVLVLDDAFQHRWIARRCDIVVMTVSEVLESDHLLPAGRRREPLSSLGRAHALVITGCTDGTECDAARKKLQAMSDLDVFYSSPVLTGVRKLGEERTVSVDALRGKRVLAVSAIGNPAAFADTLRQSGIVVASEQRFPDHHVLTRGEMSELDLICRQEACDAVIMTQKDAVRTDTQQMNSSMAGRPVYHTLMRLEWMGGSVALERLILGRIEQQGA